MSLEILS